jgi:cyclopropane-fatty-acyl-phospholipid synthase
MSFLSASIDVVERGLVPDGLVRSAIRNLCRHRLRLCDQGSPQANAAAQRLFRESMADSPVAPVPEIANAQHYELPPEFFGLVLGPHRKYSSCYWGLETQSLAEAEALALSITCERAELADGQQILELGCGWGSLSLWMAEHYPRSVITAVSNSVPQRLYLESQATARGLSNLRVVTADMNSFAAEPRSYDRVVSVEMFEHMRNYPELLRRISHWLHRDGKLFVHHFCHRTFAYPFESTGDSNWMGRYFFTGGLMPDEQLLSRFDRDLTVTGQWQWNGMHYERTANAWLAALDDNRRDVLRILSDACGPRQASRWLQRWRMFFLAVAELFGFAGGTEWYVAHVLMQPVRT